jgi:hypothetical protein
MYPAFHTTVLFSVGDGANDHDLFQKGPFYNAISSVTNLYSYAG